MSDNPPGPNEFELSLFGPGVGECVVLHLGNGDWMVVDSCVDRTTGNPVALDYLTRLGVDISTAVRHIIVTHWHDDHTQGAARILAAADNSTMYCSAALRRDEFKEVIGASATAFMDHSGVEELREMWDVVLKHSGAGGIYGRFKWAHENMCLYQSGQTSVFSLSPSAATLTRSIQEIGRLLPELGAPKRRGVSNQPNEIAVALWVEFGSVRALLGSDLEKGQNPNVGWQAIVNSTTRPPGKAQIFKDPHHGSRNADEARVWTDLLEPTPYTVLAPNRKSGLPKRSDQTRLIARTPSPKFL